MQRPCSRPHAASSCDTLRCLCVLLLLLLSLTRHRLPPHPDPQKSHRPSNSLQHIGTVRDLNRSHASLLFHMDKVGRHVLAANHGNASSPSSSHSHPERVYGFHRPPFNSVQHLHLHCIGLPWSNFFEPVRFQTGAPWFVPVGVLLKSLLIEKE